MAYSIFVSHAAGDAALAQRIFQKTHVAEIQAYLHEHDPVPGNTVSKKVLQRIQNVDAVVALLTPAGAASPYVHQEIGAALGMEKRVIALVASDVKGKLAMLEGVEYLLLPSNPDTMLHNLVMALQKAKATKTKWMWGLGGLIAGVLLATGPSKSDDGDDE